MVSDGYCLYRQRFKSRLNDQLIGIEFGLQSSGISSSIGGAIDTNSMDECVFCASLVVKAWKVLELS